jgi:GTP cyclohydrolase IA
MAKKSIKEEKKEEPTAERELVDIGGGYVTQVGSLAHKAFLNSVPTDPTMHAMMQSQNKVQFETISEVITRRIKTAKARHFACDNVSEFIYFGEKEELINEVAFKMQEVLKALLIDVENDPNSKDTARRISKMYINEIFSGRYQSEPDVTAFPNEGKDAYRGMLVKSCEIHSVCSHHHQPVWGKCYIGIIPSGKVIGLSKYTRLAQHHARRGTLQEELTVRIANRIKELTDTNDVAVYIEAEHGCCYHRGVEENDSTTQTCVISGQFNDSAVKAEFFNQIQLQKMGRNG